VVAAAACSIVGWVGFSEFSISACRHVPRLRERASARHTKKSDFRTFEKLPADRPLGNTQFKSIARKKYRYVLHTSLFSSNPAYACYLDTIYYSVPQLFVFFRFFAWIKGYVNF